MLQEEWDTSTKEGSPAWSLKRQKPSEAGLAAAHAAAGSQTAACDTPGGQPLVPAAAVDHCAATGPARMAARTAWHATLPPRTAVQASDAAAAPVAGSTARRRHAPSASIGGCLASDKDRSHSKSLPRCQV